MPTLQKFESFTHELGKGTHNFTSHTLKAMFTNAAPDAAADAVLADLTEIAAAGGYAAGGVTLDSVTWTTDGGVAELGIADETFTASGAAVGPFRYVVIYNDTATGDPLIGWADYGSALTLADGESLTLDFDASAGVLTVE